MQQNSIDTPRLDQLVKNIDIPSSYYEKAIDRFKSISQWLCRDASSVLQFNPTVYVQGSFNLGLVNRPIGSREEYDLDLVCELRGLTKRDVTQQQVKSMFGAEIKLYAKANGILEEPTERKRCWRLDYADDVRFHIDNLPCIPEETTVISRLVQLGVEYSLAKTAIALTCKQHPQYSVITPNWPMSNPAGYGIWFEGRFGKVGYNRRKSIFSAGRYISPEAVPLYVLKTPLQQSIQLLKRHRDFMFRVQNDLKPISIILTTLAAEAYSGEENLYLAMAGILERMSLFVRSGWPRVPNPVNPGEDFADKWRNNPALETNFWNWLDQARRDFDRLQSSDAPDFRRLSEGRLGIRMPEEGNEVSVSRNLSRRVAPVVIVDRGPSPWASDAQSSIRSV